MHSQPAQPGVRTSLAELIEMRHHVHEVQIFSTPARRSPLIGLHHSKLRGRGVDFDQVRVYQAGDDVRTIDWRVTARTGRTHTKVFHAERDRVTLLVADTAPTLYFGTRRCFKSVLAAEIGALTAWAAQRSGDRISVLRGSQSEAPLPPAGGSRGALRALDAVNR